MDENQVIILIDKYLKGSANAEEIQQVDSWYHSLAANPSLLSAISATELKAISEKMYHRISAAINEDPELADAFKTLLKQPERSPLD